MSHYDVIVLGGGPGGYIAAERLGHAGKTVLLIEGQALGGTCLNVGCIPTKTLLNAAKVFHHAKHGAQFGVNGDTVTVDWAAMQRWKDKTVSTLVGGVGAAEKRAGVEVLNGWGTFEGPGRVSVDGTTYTADNIILATGSEPVMPPIDGAAENPNVLDSTGILEVESIPERLTVIGGGVIGLEFAGLFATLGSDVTVVEMREEIAPMMDSEIAAALRASLAGAIEFKLGCTVTKIDGGTTAWTTSDGAHETREAEVILMAVGRRPLVSSWGAQTSGLDYSGQGIKVDDRMRTNLPGVWAVGDVTGQSLLAHAAYRMGEVAVANILDPEAHRHGERLRLHTIPWVVYTLPEAAGVGLSEDAARSAGREVLTATVPGYLSGRFVAENGLQAPGQLKIVVDAATEQVLGIHMIGPLASEIIWGACAVIETELDVNDLRQLVIPHPTVSELIREAAWAINR